MRHLTVIILAGLSILVPSGCEKNNSPADSPRNIVGTGPIVTKTLVLNEFSMIENTGVADFYVTVGVSQSVILKAQQNIIDVMTIGVLGEELQVGLEDNVSIEKADTIRFDITIPEISSIKLTGVGDFTLSGDYQEALTILLTGVGTVRAFDLEVGTCTISITGVGDCEVYVRDQLDVSILGVGTVYWKGNPQRTSSINGIGSLVDAN